MDTQELKKVVRQHKGGLGKKKYNSYTVFFHKKQETNAIDFITWLVFNNITYSLTYSKQNEQIIIKLI